MSFQRAVVLFLSIFFLLYLPTGGLERNNRFTVKINMEFKEFVKQTLKNHTFSLLYEITPEILIIDYKENDGRGYEMLDTLSKEYPKQIVRWEQVRVYVNTLKPANVGVEQILQPHPDVINENYYGMGVEDARRRGYTGKEIVIAVADVGINTDLLDLKKSINKDLSHNFVNDDDNVTPETFTENQVLALNITDHGNSVASIIAAEHGNNICADGIAFRSTIVAYKVFRVEVNQDHFQLKPSHWTASDIIARALTYKLDDIDIFVSAWSSTIPFDRLDLPISEAIEYCALKGRNKLGTIILVPAGPVGNSLSNNINTITVGSIGQYGNVPSYAFVDASVITSGLSDGSNLTADTMVTTSFENKCVNGFKGLSAATAQIAGIIALGLEANPYLSLRDVQHLLILASEHKGLKDSISFKQNGVKRHFHGVFGYGLLNATKFVRLAANKKPEPKLLNINLRMETERTVTSKTVEYKACFHCPSIKAGDCSTAVEHVFVFVSLKTSTMNLKMEVISPSGTESVLMDEIYENHQIKELEGKLVSTHFWDEISFGTWIVNIEHYHSGDVFQIKSVNITIFGTYRTEHTGLQNIEFCPDERDTTKHATIPNQDDAGNVDKNKNTNISVQGNPVYVLIGVIVGGIFAGCIALCFIHHKGSFHIGIYFHNEQNGSNREGENSPERIKLQTNVEELTYTKKLLCDMPSNSINGACGGPGEALKTSMV